MTEEEFVRTRYLDFIYEEMERLRETGMDDSDAAKLVLQTSFDTILYVWKGRYGSRKMAEHFYQIADGFVDFSNEEKTE